MAGISPTQRTLAYLKNEGYRCQVVEKWNPFSKRRIDLFGFIDIIALSKDFKIVGVQSCGQAFSDHDKKIRLECGAVAQLWLKCKGEIMLIGWRRLLVKRGGKAKVWTPRIKMYTLKDFE